LLRNESFERTGPDSVFSQLLLATAMVALVWLVQIIIYPQFQKTVDRAGTIITSNT
jgi:hypothetical protein